MMPFGYGTQRWELVRHRYFGVWTYWDWHSPKLVISVQCIHFCRLQSCLLSELAWKCEKWVELCYTATPLRFHKYVPILTNLKPQENIHTLLLKYFQFSSDGGSRTSDGWTVWNIWHHLAKGCEADWFRYLLGVSQIFFVSFFSTLDSTLTSVVWTIKLCSLSDTCREKRRSWFCIVNVVGRYEPKSPRAKHVVGTLGTLVWNGKTHRFMAFTMGFRETNFEGDNKVNLVWNEWNKLESVVPWCFFESFGMFWRWFCDFGPGTGYLAPEALQGDYSPALGTLNLIRRWTQPSVSRQFVSCDPTPRLDMRVASCTNRSVEKFRSRVAVPMLGLTFGALAWSCAQGLPCWSCEAEIQISSFQI